MTGSPNKPRKGRIVALVVIAVVILGLGYLRFAPEDGLLTVPAGAEAGDLVLEPCSYDTESGSYDADCGTLVVPENRAAPQSRLIALPVMRIRALSDQPAEPIFPLEGGPGITNMEFTQASRYADDRDVVLVGYRGVDGSVRLDCPEVTSALTHSRDWLSDESFRAYGEGLRACADRLTTEGVDLAGYGLPQRVDDLETARVAFGYERIHLLSQSAGTRTAMIYAWRYPERIYRSVMVGVNPPGHFLWDAQTHDEQMARYAELCAKDPSCRARTDDLAAAMRGTGADMPDRWLFLPINASSVQIFSFFGLMESIPNDETPIFAPMIFDAWLAAAEGDESGLWFLSLFGDLFPIPFVWGEYAAAGTLDAQAARDYFATSAQDPANIGWATSAWAWGGGQMADSWPAPPDEDAYRTVRTSEVETLLIGGTLDTSTPPQGATQDLLPYLPNGHEVVLPGLGHTGSFFAEQPEASSRLINTFFDSGQVDTSLYTPITVDFTPGSTLTAYAKIIGGTMAGLVLIMVVSLVWMWHRVRTRGSFGRPVSAVLRSVYPPDYDRAATRFSESLLHARAADDPVETGLVLFHLGVVAWGQGDPDRAGGLLSEALAIQRAAGDLAYGAAESLGFLGLLACEQGDLPRSIELQRESLSLHRETGSREVLAVNLANVAMLALAVQRPATAARLFGAAVGQREAIGNPFKLPERAVYDREIDAARTVLRDDNFAAAWDAGRSLALTEAVAEAFAALDEIGSQVTADAPSSRPASAEQGAFAGLTAREREVLRLLVAGCSNREIGDALFVSPRTAQAHIANIFAKLDVHTRAAAVGRAYDLGLA